MKLLGPGPPVPPPEPIPPGHELTWLAGDGLTHHVWDIVGSGLTSRCMIPDLTRRNKHGHVYPARSTSYLPHELGLACYQPVTCVWCAADKWRP